MFKILGPVVKIRAVAKGVRGVRPYIVNISEWQKNRVLVYFNDLDDKTCVFLKGGNSRASTMRQFGLVQPRSKGHFTFF